MGSSLPLVGTGCAARVDSGVLWGVAETVAPGVSVGVGAMVPGRGSQGHLGHGVSVADGVASPNTCVPLLSISNIWVMATGLF